MYYLQKPVKKAYKCIHWKTLQINQNAIIKLCKQLKGRQENKPKKEKKK